MSGNQEPRINLPTWKHSDFNAAIPIKKRKYFLQPQLPAMEQAGATFLQKSPQPNAQGDTSVSKSALGSSDLVEKLKIIGEPIPSFPYVPVGNSVKARSLSLDQIRVKVEDPIGFPIPSSSNIVDNSLHSSLGKLPVGAEHPGVLVSSVKTRIKVEQAHDIDRETCGKDNLRGKCQTEASVGVGTVSSRLGSKTNNNSPYWKNEESTAPNLSLSKDVFSPHCTSSVSVCAESGNHLGVDRSNWDLNTTMDAWEGLDCVTRVKTTGASETSSCHDTNVIESVSKQLQESVGFKSPTLMQLDHQVNPTCSLSLGLSSYCPVENSPSLPATTLEARANFTSVSPPIVIPGNVKSVNLRTPKSEVIEDSVRQETDKSQVCPSELSIRVKHEIVSSPSSSVFKPTDSISLKAEPQNFTQYEVFNRKDGALNHLQKPIMQSNEVLDLPTGSTSKQKEKYIPCSNGIDNAPTSLNGMIINPGFWNHPDYTSKENSSQSNSAANGKLCEVLKHDGVDITYSCSDHADHNLNASGVDVTSLSEEKILHDCKTHILKRPLHNSRETDELRISDEDKTISSGMEPEEELCSYGFESGHEEKVLGPAAVFTEDNEVRQAECCGYETEQRDISVPFHSDNQNTNHVEDKGSQPAILVNTGNKHIEEYSVSPFTNKFKRYAVTEPCLELVEMANTEVQNKRVNPKLQSGIFDGSGEKEGRVVQDGEQSTYQMVQASEGMSGVSTVSAENVVNPEVVENSSPVSYKTVHNDRPAESSEGSQSRIINLAQVSNNFPDKTLDASDSFVPLRMERDRLSDFQFEPRKYLFRGSDESCKFSRERDHGRNMRSPRFNYMHDRRRLSEKTESNLHDRDSKNFEFDNHGSTNGRGGFIKKFNRGRRPGNDEVTPNFSHSFTRRNPNFSFTHRGSTNKEDASTFHGFRDSENFTRGLQCNNTEPMFMRPERPYQGRNGSFGRGVAKFSNNLKRGFRSRSPVRSRERSDGPSLTFRNIPQEELSENTEFPRRRSPSGYRMERLSSPDHSGYTREIGGRRHNSTHYSHRPSNPGRGRGYARGRGYGRDGFTFRKPYDRVTHRYHGNLNNLDSRERVQYSEDFLKVPIHSERFGVDVEKRRFSYRHDGTSSFRPSFNNDGCTPTNVENNPDAVRFGQDPDAVRFGQDRVIEEQGSFMKIDGKNKNLTENACAGTRNMEEEETCKHSKIWQQDELTGEGF